MIEWLRVRLLAGALPGSDSGQVTCSHPCTSVTKQCNLVLRCKNREGIPSIILGAKPYLENETK